MLLTTTPHLAPRLKKEWSYTSTPPVGLHRLNFTFYYHNSEYLLRQSKSFCFSNGDVMFSVRANVVSKGKYALVQTIKAYGQVQLFSFVTSKLNIKSLISLTTQLVYSERRNTRYPLSRRLVTIQR